MGYQGAHAPYSIPMTPRQRAYILHTMLYAAPLAFLLILAPLS
jgi:hypothetical protein